ncbi:flagellin [Neoroseomonas lacus]|uniref:Flagellin n=1 Tax=Neoroseomonas lacus TaxID=287609 RepID=A0A917NMU5_9PROT|nr:flagellin [Neoroseomonas lacus]GGJ12006.1 flagellin [Neoroseomonas lacus]
MTAINSVSRLDAGAQALRLRLDVLTRQQSDGFKGPAYGDIAPDAHRAIDLRADVARREVWQGTIDRTLARTSVTQNALGRLSDIATNFYEQSITIDGTNGVLVASIATQARAAMQEVANLLNERYGGEYVFGGTDTANPPVPDAQGIASSGMATDIAAAVASLTTGNAATVAAATLAAATSDTAGTTPFSAFLSDPATGLAEARRSVPAAEGQRVDYGILANRNAAATSEGETTGSWARDLLRGLATLAALDPSQTVLGTDFTDIVATARDGLRSAVDALGEERGALGATEERLGAISQRHSEVTVTLTTQLAAIQEVDMADTISQLNATKTQLEASYRAIAMVQGLSLTNFL